MGHPIVQSPCIDALAAEGVTFTNQFTNSPLCVPARATMMTGWMPHVTGAWTNDMYAPSLGLSHVRDLRDLAGYETAIVGKAHLYANKGHPADVLNVAKLIEWGFDYVFELLSQPNTAHAPNAYRDFLDARDLQYPDGLGRRIDRYAGYVDNFDYYSMPAIDVAPYSLTHDENLDVFCGRHARDWLLARSDSRPFYLQVNFPGPHKPYDSTTETRNAIDLTDPAFLPGILGPPGDPMSAMVEFIWSQKGLFGMTAEESKYLLMQYYAKIAMIDQTVGEIIDALKATGQYENTWIIYGADHGDMLGDHEIWGKVVMYEGAIRTPLIIRPPGGTAGWQATGMCDQKDITASIVAMAGLTTDHLPGTSLVGRVEGGASGPDAQGGHAEVYAEVIGDEWDLRFKTVMMRDGRYKLVYDVEEDKPTDFFDLEADPVEKVNLVLEPAYQAQISAGMLKIKDLLVQEVPATST